MTLLFCNVGWMKNYKGINDDGSIEWGGAYNKHSTGLEVCNFSDNKGVLYGHVQPRGQIKIERLGASKEDNFVSGVTVVWTARAESGGTVVIGWYKNATVYRNVQTIHEPSELQKKNGVNSYRIRALASKAVLLPIKRRELIIPRGVKGGIGKSNVWFADAEESKELVENVVAFIEQGSFPRIPDVDEIQSILEGNPRLLTHLRRERSAALVKKKKDATMRATGKLCCEVCGFDFKDAYGDIGDGFCEVHHLLPLSKADGIVKTKLTDLAIVCSNCHRVLHRSNPMLTISNLSKLFKKASS
ncbi:HNH endonuclease [Hydromonas duriensis]|uniref:5-methylcytosine-specific restriction protein A n=1 Tax=Hydromonas duriensis TaxID=1527608 RepID=A0A4R6Y9L2_9BURK|nr:HNH endonuclease [Hydromonas duriensis]TDR32140.1 5-methylcytosine-specific restriction protein A [Hydromonas duriensis]